MTVQSTVVHITTRCSKRKLFCRGIEIHHRHYGREVRVMLWYNPRSQLPLAARLAKTLGGIM